MVEWPRPMPALTLGSTRCVCLEQRSQRDAQAAAGVVYGRGSPATRAKSGTGRQTEHESGETSQDESIRGPVCL